MMTFKEKLVVLRKIKHLTQDEFASAVGVSRQAVYKWESGQSYPEVQKLIEMKLLFGISIDDLLDDTFEIELPKKKRRKRKPKTEEAQAEVAEVKTEAPAPKAEAPKAETKKAEPKVEEVKAKAAPKAEPKVEEVKVEAPTTSEPEEKVAKTEVPKIEATKIDINDPTDKYAKRGGLFGRIFGKK